MPSFKLWSFKDYIVKTLNDIHFNKPTKIQEGVIPLALKGKDVVGRSHTGSGKTHAYLIPIFQNLDETKNCVQAVILAPTRELAMQIGEKCLEFTKNNPDIRIRLVTGGLDRNRMIDKVANTPHILIGTPGRIKDIAFVQNAINITTAKTLVLDEADMILESGFMEDVGMIAGKMKIDLQMLVFSATIPVGLKHFLQKYMTQPNYVEPDKSEKTSAKVEHIAIPSRHKDKNLVLLEVLKAINPYLCLIFASRKTTVEDTYKFLKKEGFNVGVIHGDLEPGKRRTMMKQINENKFEYVVCSDIAARGIDIEGVTHIINIDLPYELEFYFHRAGRTGRYTADGICYTIYCKEEMDSVNKLIEQGIKFKHFDVKDGQFKELKPLIREKKPKQIGEITEGDIKIKKIVRETQSKNVKPGYKKKMKKEIERVKRQEKRKIIRADIKRQIRERAIAKSKAEKGE